MVLINCACCAAPLPHPAKQCSRCKTLYCSPACQKQHWEQGGHDKLCRKIRKGGGAEQYHADTKFKEAVTVAAEACKEDAKGQKCYICGDDKEGLVRMCACRGTAGFAHVSCLAEQAKILLAEAKENNLGEDAINARWRQWHTCGLCKQSYHGVVRCALGWACWKTYLGRPETDWARLHAMTELGHGLSGVGQYEDALSVREAELSTLKRLGATEDLMLVTQSNFASAYNNLGRQQDALRMSRDVYSGRLRFNGGEHEETVVAAGNYASSLFSLRRFDEARALLRNMVPVARRTLGESHELTLRMRSAYAQSLYMDDGGSLEDLREAGITLEEIEPTARRLLGGANPITLRIEQHLRNARAALRSREDAEPDVSAQDLDAAEAARRQDTIEQQRRRTG